MLTLSALNKQQSIQVAYLFADHLFGTDASAYLYSLNQRGDVSGRTPTASDDGHRTTKGVTVTNIMNCIDDHASGEQIRAAQMHMDALAAEVAMKLYQKHFEEVDHEY